MNRLTKEWLRLGLMKIHPVDNMPIWDYANIARFDTTLLGELAYNGKEAFERFCRNTGNVPIVVLAKYGLNEDGMGK